MLQCQEMRMKVIANQEIEEKKADDAHFVHQYTGCNAQNTDTQKYTSGHTPATQRQKQTHTEMGTQATRKHTQCSLAKAI